MEEETGRTPQISDIPPSSSSPSTLDDESCINSVFGSAPTQAEADYSMTAFQSFMNLEGQPVEIAFQFIKTNPIVQEMVGSVMSDIGVVTAMLKNGAVQAFIRSLMLGNSAKRLTNSATGIAEANSSQHQESHNKHGLISMILSWLLENTEGGFVRIFGILRSLFNNPFESFKNESKDSAGNSANKSATGIAAANSSQHQESHNEHGLISYLQKLCFVMQGLSASIWVLDHFYGHVPGILQSTGFQSVNNALKLLQIALKLLQIALRAQRMVVSLSSDKIV